MDSMHVLDVKSVYVEYSLADQRDMMTVVVRVLRDTGDGVKFIEDRKFLYECETGMDVIKEELIKVREALDKDAELNTITVKTEQDMKNAGEVSKSLTGLQL